MPLGLRLLVVFASAVVVASKCFEGDELVTAQCNLRPRGGDVSGIEGKVDIIQVTNPDTGVSRTYFKVKITGLQPNSAHGFHIHKQGEIFGAQGCKGAGGHYNPLNRTHGSQTDTERHVGDFGNVYADKNGVVMVIKSNRNDLLTGEHSIMGRAIVLHAKRDDLGKGGDQGSAKTGNAGGRIACGVIVNT